MNETAPTFKRIATLDVSTVLLLISREQPFTINDIVISTGSPRLRTYLKGTTCPTCGLVGSFFAVEATKPNYVDYHLNLYARDQAGNEVPMSSDHIHPRSCGGGGSLRNRQPMCRPCNIAKGATIQPPKSS